MSNDDRESKAIAAMEENFKEESDSEKQDRRDRFMRGVEFFHLLCDVVKAVNQNDVPHLRRLLPWMFSYLRTRHGSFDTFVDQVRNKKGPPCLKSVSDSFVFHADHKLRPTLKSIPGDNYEHSDDFVAQARNDWQKYLDTAYKTQKDAAKVNVALRLTHSEGGRTALPNVERGYLQNINLATLNNILGYVGGDHVSKPKTT